LPRAARIRSRSDFDRVFKAKNRASDANLTVYMGRHAAGLARLGIAAGRRLGNAVVRNRMKRLVREAFRRLRAELPPGTDWVVVPQRPGVSLQAIDESLRYLTRKLLQRAGRVGEKQTPLG
jgi:ribonuclease P protein component